MRAWMRAVAVSTVVAAGVTSPGAASAAPAVAVDDDGQAAVGDCAATSPAPSTIAAGVDAADAGGTVHVCPGSYSEQVTVAKPVTIAGAQAGVDARDGRPGAAESILVDGSILVAADDVVIDGLAMRDTSFEPASQPVASVRFDASQRRGVIRNTVLRNQRVLLDVSGTDVQVLRNLFDNSGVDVHYGATAVAAYVAPGARIEDNRVVGPGAISVGGSNVSVARNEIAGPGVGAGIWVSSASPAWVTGNSVADAQGIGVAASAGVSVVGNEITRPAASGVDVAASSDVRVEGNTITGAGDDGVAVSSADECFATPRGTECWPPEPSRAVRITGNTITDSGGVGVAVGATLDGQPAVADTVVARRNRIERNANGGVWSAGRRSDGVAVIDARSNWWGAASGPSGWGTGSAAVVGHSVDFFPWATRADFTAFRACDRTGANITGTSRNEVLCGTAGIDVIRGGGGADLLLGYGGADRLSGDGGADALIGGPDGDVLLGGAAFDHLQGRHGIDVCDGGADGGEAATCEP